MKRIIFLFISILTPIIIKAQSGISLSGASQFNIGQTVNNLNNDFLPVNYESRMNKLTLSLFRGRKFRFGTLAVNAKISYSINQINYEYSEISDVSNYKIRTINVIPALEFWYIMFQTENIFLYSSIGNYGIISDLNIGSHDYENNIFEYNKIIPFFRLGTQLSYGRFFINPFVSFDLKGIEFDKFEELWNFELKDQLQNYSIRSGLEFGIMF